MFTIIVHLDCVAVMPALGLPVAVMCDVSCSGLDWTPLQTPSTPDRLLAPLIGIVTALADPAVPSELGEGGRVVGG